MKTTFLKAKPLPELPWHIVWMDNLMDRPINESPKPSSVKNCLPDVSKSNPFLEYEVSGD